MLDELIGLDAEDKIQCEPNLYKNLSEAYLATDAEREKMQKYYPSELLGIDEQEVIREDLFTRDTELSEDDQKILQSYLENFISLARADNTCDTVGVNYILKFFNIRCSQAITPNNIDAGKELLIYLTELDAKIVKEAYKQSKCI